MGKKRRARDADKQPTTPDGGPLSQGLGALLRAQGLTPSAQPEAPPPKQTSAPTADSPDTTLPWSRVAGWPARRERKGRKGKTVTCIAVRDTDRTTAEAIARALGKGLGCRAFLEENEIVLQGDHTDALPAWLERQH